MGSRNPGIGARSVARRPASARPRDRRRFRARFEEAARLQQREGAPSRREPHSCRQDSLVRSGRWRRRPHSPALVVVTRCRDPLLRRAPTAALIRVVRAQVGARRAAPAPSALGTAGGREQQAEEGGRGQLERRRASELGRRRGERRRSGRRVHPGGLRSGGFAGDPRRLSGRRRRRDLGCAILGFARVLARVPGGPPDPARLPELFRVERVCSAQSSFVVSDSGSTFERVDWESHPQGLWIWHNGRVGFGRRSARCAGALEPGDLENEGCHGGAWENSS